MRRTVSSADVSLTLLLREVIICGSHDNNGAYPAHRRVRTETVDTKRFTGIVGRQGRSRTQQKRGLEAEQRLRRIAAQEKTRRRKSVTSVASQRTTLSPESDWGDAERVTERFAPPQTAPVRGRVQQPRPIRANRGRRRGLVDHVLLAVEIVALLGLAVVLYGSFTTWRVLSRQVPTATSAAGHSVGTSMPTVSATASPETTHTELTPTQSQDHQEISSSPREATTPTLVSPTVTLSSQAEHGSVSDAYPAPAPTIARAALSVPRPASTVTPMSTSSAIPTLTASATPSPPQSATPALTASATHSLPQSATPTLTASPTRSLTPSSTPTLAPQVAMRIVIPSIGVDAPVVQGDSWEDLKRGVGQHPDTAQPGAPGNMVVSAHNDAFDKIFRHLHKLVSGDHVYVYTVDMSYDYEVVDTRIVNPDDLSAIGETDEPTLTMITCYPYLIDTHRVVVSAVLAD